jgi:antitoxin YefM
MKAMTFTAARENLADTMQRVCEDHAPVVITRRRGQAVVMMALEDYQALEETAYLLRSPRNAKRLRQAVEQLRHGKGTKRIKTQKLEEKHRQGYLRNPVRTGEFDVWEREQKWGYE